MDLTVSMLQTSLVWENRQANLAHLTQKIESLPAFNHLIVLPEMFSSGFTMNTNLAETMEGESVLWMHRMAQMKSAVIAGSVMIRENDHVFNRLIWMRPDGTYEYYDKRHLFRMADEHEHYVAGNSRKVFILNNWKVCPMICYDLRFPVWSRNRLIDNEHEYDLLLYVANWPERRSHAWKSLLVARAIENQSYVIGVNRVGRDGKEVSYSGDSVILNYLGEPLSREARFADKSETVALSKDDLQKYRSEFPAGLDADSFNIEL
jgi:omega-amidase